MNAAERIAKAVYEAQDQIQPSVDRIHWAECRRDFPGEAQAMIAAAQAELRAIVEPRIKANQTRADDNKNAVPAGCELPHYNACIMASHLGAVRALEFLRD